MIGKLQFVSHVIRSSRVFIARLLDDLRGMNRLDKYPVSQMLKRDVFWWQSMIPVMNGTRSIYEEIWWEPGALIDTDACLVGGGAVCRGEYFHIQFPEPMRQQPHIIAHWELWTLMVAVKVWASSLYNRHFTVCLDNTVSVSAINSGRSSDKFLTECL